MNRVRGPPCLLPRNLRRAAESGRFLSPSRSAVIRSSLSVAGYSSRLQDPLTLFSSENSQSRIKVYLRTISKNARHPCAALPELVSPIPFELGSSFIQIVDDVVGMFFWVHGPGLIVWNWHTAEVIVVRRTFVCYRSRAPVSRAAQKRTSDAMPNSTWDFSFLSNRAYMVTATGEAGTIELFSFRGRSDVTATTVEGETGADTSAHVATLRLPRLRAGHEPHHFATHSGPFVRYQTRGHAFGTARESRVHLMSIHYGERGPRFHMFVLNRFLLSLYPRGEWAPVPSSASVHEWEGWGAKNTRFLEHSVNFQWLRCVSPAIGAYTDTDAWWLMGAGMCMARASCSHRSCPRGRCSSRRSVCLTLTCTRSAWTTRSRWTALRTGASSSRRRRGFWRPPCSRTTSSPPCRTWRLRGPASSSTPGS